MIQTDLNSMRRRLTEFGISRELADDPKKGSFLAALLAQRLAGEEVSTRAAAVAAGIAPATHRKWRSRSPAFAAAEHRSRFGTAEGLPAPEDVRPGPAVIQQLRERLQHAVDYCASEGPGPWRLYTKYQREAATSTYAANRQIAIETIAELKGNGVTDRLPPVPPEAVPYPKQRVRRAPITDTSGWLWPPSLNAHLIEQRRSR